VKKILVPHRFLLQVLLLFINMLLRNWTPEQTRECTSLGINIALFSEKSQLLLTLIYLQWFM
jgi:hypothetical protein